MQRKKGKKNRMQTLHYKEKVERRQLKNSGMHVSISMNTVKLKD